jgi:hypothetical protein
MSQLRFIAALLVGLLVVASLAAAGGERLSAQAGGLPLFGETSSIWRIVAGYNTATHVGDDPYALDLVRIDAPTAGSVVHAPVTGRLGFVSSECLTIGDERGNEILLCHLFPAAGLGRGTIVSAGDPLGTVAPPGFSGNNGLAHIHVAVHETLGDGQLLRSLPFTGPYALEGRELPATPEFGAHAGLEFVSTNGTVLPTPGLELPADVVTPEIEPLVAAESVPPVVVFPGWNMVSWPTGGPISPDDQGFPAEVKTVLAFDGPTQRFVRWSAGVPPELNTLTEVTAGFGTLIFSTGDAPFEWDLPQDPVPATIALQAGFNLVTWRGPSATVADARESLGDTFVALHALDAAQQVYESFHVGVPEPLNTLRSLGANQTVWIEVTESVHWVQLVTPNPVPTEVPASQELDEPLPVADTPLFVLGPGCLNLRLQPTTVSNTPITCMAVGAEVVPTGVPVSDAAGREWLPVTFNGRPGWAAAEFLRADADPFGADGIAGEATFYHPSLAGDPMYCGGVYDPTDLTIAASTRWPCGTRLRVSTAGASIDVIVQDTGLLGPAHIDLSEAAFELLAPLAEGRLAVSIEVLS